MLPLDNPNTHISHPPIYETPLPPTSHTTRMTTSGDQGTAHKRITVMPLTKEIIALEWKIGSRYTSSQTEILKG